MTIDGHGIIESMNNFNIAPRPTTDPRRAENLTLNFEEIKFTRDVEHDKWIDVLSTDWG